MAEPPRLDRSPCGRFAPSPTGDLHLGNLATALIAFSSSRSVGGRFVIRMEDLDRITSRHEFEERQLEDLAAVGVTSDVEVVRQSERFDRYHDAVEYLRESGRLYPCYCTRREIAEAVQAPHGTTAGYPGTCRDLRQSRHDRPAAWRFRSTRQIVTFEDRVHGTCQYASDDVVVVRNDGVPAYNLAVVVDDADQEVTEVVRGDDLLHVTASQIELARALGLPSPSYAHVPLMVNEQGERLSKRDGAVTLRDHIALGHTPGIVRSALLDAYGFREDEWDSIARHPVLVPPVLFTTPGSQS